MGATTSSRRFHSHPDLIIVHVVPASQYSTKVLAALSQRRLKHALEFAHGEPSRRVLPSGGDMVPELEFAGVGTPDSAAILRFLDERIPELAAVKFFPTEDEVGESVATRVNQLERLAEEELDLYCNYFNFVNDAGHRRSVRQSLARYVPWWAVWLNIDDLLAGRRSECTEACRIYFSKVQPSSPDQQLDESVVRAAWLEMLGRLEVNFECEEQSYLCGTAQPTAADFGVRAIIVFCSA
jgi:glutathione S-transferase